MKRILRLMNMPYEQAAAGRWRWSFMAVEKGLTARGRGW